MTTRTTGKWLFTDCVKNYNKSIGFTTDGQMQTQIHSNTPSQRGENTVTGGYEDELSCPPLGLNTTILYILYYHTMFASMYGNGHRGLNAIIGTALGLAFFQFTPSPFAFLLTVFTVVGVASLPDIDIHFDPQLAHSSSSSIVTAAPINHRGITHTVLFAAIVGVLWGGVFIFLSSYLRPVLYIAPSIHLGIIAGVAGFTGIVGHILGDVVTHRPLRLFWPLTDAQYAVGLFQSRHTAVNRTLWYLGQFTLVLGLLFVSWDTWMRFRAVRTAMEASVSFLWGVQ